MIDFGTDRILVKCSDTETRYYGTWNSENTAENTDNCSRTALDTFEEPLLPFRIIYDKWC